jgi:hypothetical protein
MVTFIFCTQNSSTSCHKHFVQYDAKKVCHNLIMGDDTGKKTSINFDWLIDWFYIVLCLAQECFTYMEMSPLLVKGCKISAYARCSGPLNRRDGFIMPHLLLHGTLAFLVSSEGLSHSVASYDTQGMWRICSNPDPHGSPLGQIWKYVWFWLPYLP